MKNLKGSLKNLLYSVAGAGTVALLNVAPSFADESALTGVTQAITTATGEVKTEGTKVISLGISIGILFWGAKVVWSKFKSMAK